jgi:hypothetical protein
VRLEGLGQLKNPIISSEIEGSVNKWTYKSNNSDYPSHVSLYVKEKAFSKRRKSFLTDVPTDTREFSLFIRR